MECRGEMNDEFSLGSSKPLDLLSLLRSGSPPFLMAESVVTIHGLKGAVGLTLSGRDEVMVVCKDECVVWRYDRDGSLLGKLAPNRPFVQPTDILAMKSGQIVVRDEQGLQLFAENGECVGCLGKQIDRCYGLAEDVDGHLVTINCNQQRKMIHVTSPGQTDVFYIDVAEDRLVKRVELQEVIGPEEKTRSMCRSLACHDDRLYVVDQGLNRV